MARMRMALSIRPIRGLISVSRSQAPAWERLRPQAPPAVRQKLRAMPGGVGRSQAEPWEQRDLRPTAELSQKRSGNDGCMKEM